MGAIGGLERIEEEAPAWFGKLYYLAAGDDGAKRRCTTIPASAVLAEQQEGPYV